jgi:hypothetical protein
MRYKHFYEPAFTSLCENEDQALRLWSATLRRGLSALQYKRYQAAEIYLGAAYELGILRLDCKNRIFDATHVIQPALRLTELFLAIGKIAAARSFFNETQLLLQTKRVALPQFQKQLLHESNQVLQQLQRGQNLPMTPEQDISDLPSSKPVESRPQRRHINKTGAHHVQGIRS